MIRNLKALGLALVAMLAFGVMSASTASATDFFTTSKDKAWITGTGTHNGVAPNRFFITNSSGGTIAEVACTSAKFTGTVLNKDDEATVLAEYFGTANATPHVKGTHCSGIGTPTVKMNGCHYKLTGNTTGSDNGTDATVWIECPAPNRIEIDTHLGATLKIPTQTPTSGGVIYTNKPNHAGGKAVEIDATATGITFECSPAFSCGLAGIPTHSNNSDYTGEVIATGYEHLGGTFAAPTEGAQIPIEQS